MIDSRVKVPVQYLFQSNDQGDERDPSIAKWKDSKPPCTILHGPTEPDSQLTENT